MCESETDLKNAETLTGVLRLIYVVSSSRCFDVNESVPVNTHVYRKSVIHKTDSKRLT